MKDKDKLERTARALLALVNICEAAPEMPSKCIGPVISEIRKWLK